MQAIIETSDTAGVQVHGTCDQRFTRVRDLLATQLATGADLGASAAVFIDGEPVVGIWGGFIDAGSWTSTSDGALASPCRMPPSSRSMDLASPAGASPRGAARVDRPCSTTSTRA